MLLLPEELIFTIINELDNIEDKKSLLYIDTKYIKYIKKLNIKYMIFEIFSDNEGYPNSNVLAVCDNLALCKSIIKQIKKPITTSAYQCMNEHNLYTILGKRNTSKLGQFYHYYGSGYIIEEIQLNKLV